MDTLVNGSAIEVHLRKNTAVVPDRKIAADSSLSFQDLGNISKPIPKPIEDDISPSLCSLDLAKLQNHYHNP